MIGSVRGTVIERTHERRGARRGRRRRLPRHVPLSRRSRRSIRAATRSCSRTSTCAKTRWCSTGSRRRDERDTFEALIARDRRRAEARARDPVGAHARRVAPLPRRRRPRRARARARRRQAHRAAAARRAEGAARGARPRSHRGTGRADVERRAPRCARRSSGSATRPTRCASVLGQLADDGTVEELLRDALRVCWPGARR